MASQPEAQRGPCASILPVNAPEASDEGTTILPFATDTELPSIVTPVANVELEATLTLVVDGQVTFDLNVHSTVASGTTAVTADLSVGGASLSGITVTFSLAGGGGLSATSAVTDSVGHAEVSYLAPATSTSVIVACKPWTVTSQPSSPRGPVEIVQRLISAPKIRSTLGNDSSTAFLGREG